MKLLIVIFLLCLLPSIHTQCSTKTVFPLIYGRKEIQENVVLHDFKNSYSGGGYLLGGEYVDNSSATQKGFFMYAREFGDAEYKYIYSTGSMDIVNKVALGSSYNFAAGRSGAGSSSVFFILRAQGPWSPPQVRQAGGDTNSVNANSEIGKFW